MLRIRGFAIGVAVGVGITVAVTASWKGTIAQGDRIYTAPGDVDGDGDLTIGDAIFLLNYLFAEGPEPARCPRRGRRAASTGPAM